jgi:hypothetical protein
MTLCAFTALVTVCVAGNALVLFYTLGTGQGVSNTSGFVVEKKLVWVIIIHPLLRSIVRWVVSNVIALAVTRYSHLDFFDEVLPVFTRVVQLVFAIPTQIVIASSQNISTLALLVVGTLPGELSSMWFTVAWHGYQNNKYWGTVAWRQYLVVAANDMYTDLLGIVIGWYLAMFTFNLIGPQNRYVIFVRLVIGVLHGVAIVGSFFTMARHYGFIVSANDVRLRWHDITHLVRICAAVSILMSITIQACVADAECNFRHE